MEWQIEPTEAAFKAASPNPKYPLFFSPKTGYSWAEHHYAGIRLHHEPGKNDLKKIEIEFNNDQDAEFQRPFLKVFWELVAPNESANELLEWTFQRLREHTVHEKKTEIAKVTMNVSLQKVLLVAVPKAEDLETDY